MNWWRMAASLNAGALYRSMLLLQSSASWLISAGTRIGARCGGQRNTPPVLSRVGAIPFDRGVLYHNRVGLGWSQNREAAAGRPGRVRDRWGARGRSDGLRIPGAAGMSAGQVQRTAEVRCTFSSGTESCY